MLDRLQLSRRLFQAVHSWLSVTARVLSWQCDEGRRIGRQPRPGYATLSPAARPRPSRKAVSSSIENSGIEGFVNPALPNDLVAPSPAGGDHVMANALGDLDVRISGALRSVTSPVLAKYQSRPAPPVS